MGDQDPSPDRVEIGSLTERRMKNEEHSAKLYNDLKASCRDEDLRKLFAFLAKRRLNTR